jgi:succinate dehydrogenase / fumarate reductase iron-sulfur subunit
MRVAIQRFDPERDSRPRWMIYELEVPSRWTVMDAVLRVAEEQDPTLAFRRMCRSGVCGACAAVVNDQSVLMCQTLVGEVVRRGVAGTQEETGRAGGSSGPEEVTGWDQLPEADLLIRPLPRFRVLRDLVVDLEPFLGSLERVHAWIIPRSSYDGRVPWDTARKLWGVAPCVLCGICAAVSGCGGEGEVMDGAGENPAAVARAVRMALDPRDELGLDRWPLLAKRGGLPLARLASLLREVCPKGVDIEALSKDLPPAVRGAE